MSTISFFCACNCRQSVFDSFINLCFLCYFRFVKSHVCTFLEFHPKKTKQNIEKKQRKAKIEKENSKRRKFLAFKSKFKYLYSKKREKRWKNKKIFPRGGIEKEGIQQRYIQTLTPSQGTCLHTKSIATKII